MEICPDSFQNLVGDCVVECDFKDAATASTLNFEKALGCSVFDFSIDLQLSKEND